MKYEIANTKLTVELNNWQEKALSILKETYSIHVQHRAMGRTFLLCVIIIEQAMEHLKQPTKIFDHYQGASIKTIDCMHSTIKHILELNKNIKIDYEINQMYLTINKLEIIGE